MMNDLHAQSQIVQQKLGRNIVLINILEKLLKQLEPMVLPGGFNATPESTEALKSTRNNKSTLGSLFGSFQKWLFSSAEISNTNQKDGVSLNIQLSKEADEATLKAFVEKTQKLVDDRNEIIHHFIDRWNIQDLASMKDAEKYLDDQRMEIIDRIRYFHELHRFLNGAMEDTQSFLRSDIFKLLNSNTIQILNHHAWATKRPDRWAVLNTAATLIDRNCRDEYDALKKRFGVSKLKDLMGKLDIYEYSEETTEGGGTRVLYRHKQEGDISINVMPQ